MLDKMKSPKGYLATDEDLKSIQKREIRLGLRVEQQQMIRGNSDLDNLAPATWVNPGVGVVFGLLTGVMISTISRGSLVTGVSIGAGMGMVTAGGISMLMEGGFESAKKGLIEVRLKNFSERVWAQLPADRRKSIEETMLVNK